MLDPKSKLITIEKPKKIQIEDSSKKLYLREEKRIITVNAPQGIAGAPGDGETFTSAEDISYGDILYFKADGLVYKAGYNLPDLISDFNISFFMSQTEALAGNLIFCRFKGKITFTNPFLNPGKI